MNNLHLFIGIVSSIVVLIAGVLAVLVRWHKLSNEHLTEFDRITTEKVKIPVEDLRSSVEHSITTLNTRVDDLDTQIYKFTQREKIDHQTLLAVMKKSDHSHKEILTVMRKLEKDHKEIKSHQHKLTIQKAALDQHKKDIKWLERNKADKQKRGNQK